MIHEPTKSEKGRCVCGEPDWPLCGQAYKPREGSTLPGVECCQNKVMDQGVLSRCSHDAACHAPPQPAADHVEDARTMVAAPIEDARGVVDEEWAVYTDTTARTVDLVSSSGKSLRLDTNQFGTLEDAVHYACWMTLPGLSKTATPSPIAPVASPDEDVRGVVDEATPAGADAYTVLEGLYSLHARGGFTVPDTHYALIAAAAHVLATPPPSSEASPDERDERDERAEFEAWAGNEDYSTGRMLSNPRCYAYHNVEMLWECWQAARGGRSQP